MNPDAADIALRNCRIVSDGRASDGDLWISGGRIIGVGHISPPRGIEERDLAGKTVLPGLIDIQVNGLGGLEVHNADVNDIASILHTAPRLGCTSLLVTQVSALPDAYQQLSAALQTVPTGGARLLGVHIEGPFLDPEHPGAHLPETLRPPQIDETRRILNQFDGQVRIWTVAPEQPGAESVVDFLNESGVVVGAGHSGLGVEEAHRWFRRGVSLVTHLYNAMAGLHHRAPGLAVAALTDHEVSFSVIADGHHSHPDMVRLAHKAGGERLILITDAVAPAGALDGTYTVGGTEVVAEAGVVRLPDGTLAGSALEAIDAVFNLASFAGISLAEASVAMTSRPADLLGRTDIGRLEEDHHADLLILDAQGLAETWVGGEVLHRPTDAVSGVDE